MQLLGEYVQGGFIGYCCAVPALKLHQGQRDQFGHGRVMHAAPEHAADGRNEGQENEGQQRHHEQKGGQAFLAAGAGGLAGFGSGKG
ncbi:hypothetical protein D3C78_1790320 [compost metagenome]